MPNQNKLDKTYLKMAQAWAEMSHATRKKVGCLIVKDERIISDGFNGTPSGFDNDCEEVFYTYDERDFYRDQEWQLDKGKDKFFKLKTKPEVLHAESNALMKLARSTNSSEGATIYCTYSPCFDCAKLIVQSGVKRFVYNETYRKTEGLDLLKKAGVEIAKYE
jgi:dCMP deaminase